MHLSTGAKKDGIHEQMCSRSSNSNMPPLILILIGRCEERALSRKYIVDCVKGSLERLQLDFIDVVIIHRADSACPMEGK